MHSCKGRGFLFVSLILEKVQENSKMPSPVNVYLGLGSNMGERRELMMQAIEMLTQSLGRPIQLSAIMETEPWGFSSPNKFLNMVALFSTNIPPLELLDITEGIECRLGRRVKSLGDGEYSDRPMDIDILLYGDKVIESPRLTVPHPRMHERPFVLVPLAQIAPDLVHPALNKSLLELRNRLLM